MMRFLGRRLLIMIPVFFGITLVTFAVIHLTPGGPSQTSDFNARMTAESRARLRQLYGLDKPLAVQYLSWAWRLVRLDFGSSFRDGRPAINKIAERIPATLLLNFLSLALILIVALPLGVVAAVYHRSIFDRITTLIVFLGFSMPAYWLALLLMIFFGLKLGWLPVSGLHSVNYDVMSGWARLLDTAQHLVLPVAVSAFTGLAGLTRYTRASTLETLRQEYIRTAHAKGLTQSAIVIRHALRNALLPIITVLGLSLPALIGGGFIFETIFAYPGMGRLGFDAILSRDYPVIMAVGTITAILTLSGNLLADICYAFADPRIRYQEQE